MAVFKGRQNKKPKENGPKILGGKMELYVTKIGGVSNQPLAKILCVTSIIRIINIMLNKGVFVLYYSQYTKPINSLFSVGYSVLFMSQICRLRAAQTSETTKRVV